MLISIRHPWRAIRKSAMKKMFEDLRETAENRQRRRKNYFRRRLLVMNN
jgi:hypothetical protein